MVNVLLLEATTALCKCGKQPKACDRGVALAFEPEEFYAPERIELGVMPSTSIQQPYFAKFRQRMGEVMRTFLNNYQPISSVEAERLVWQPLEEELLQLPARVTGEI
jgi:hypothetical protein